MTSLRRTLRVWRGLFSWYCFTTGPWGDWTPFYPFASSRNQIIVSRSNRLRLQNHVIPSAALMALWWRYNSRRLLETPRVSLWACFLKMECFSELFLVGGGGPRVIVNFHKDEIFFFFFCNFVWIPRGCVCGRKELYLSAFIPWKWWKVKFLRQLEASFFVLSIFWNPVFASCTSTAPHWACPPGIYHYYITCQLSASVTSLLHHIGFFFHVCTFNSTKAVLSCVGCFKIQL